MKRATPKYLSSCVFFYRVPQVVLLFDRDFELYYFSSELLSCVTFRQRFWIVHFPSEIFRCASLRQVVWAVIFFVRGVYMSLFIELCFNTWITLYFSKNVWKKIIRNLDFLHPEVRKCNVFSDLMGDNSENTSEFRAWWESDGTLLVSFYLLTINH